MSGLILVPVAPGFDTSIPTGPQVSAKFTLTGPDGTRAVFNDQSDRDYVGMLKEITGLDSPDVRESAEDLVQMDGGIHGDFFYGRRPMTLTGLILNPASADDRNRRMTKLMRASNAMRGDATLSWTLEGGYEQFVRVRRQQPLRITGAWQKEFQLAVVAADPRVYGAEFQSAYSSSVPERIIAENKGNFITYPIITVYGEGDHPVIENSTTGEAIRLVYNLDAGDYLTIDTLNRTVVLNDELSQYSAVNFLESDWWGIVPGINDLRLSWETSEPDSGFVVQWRDAWL